MRTISNPPNPFDTIHREHLGAPPPVVPEQFEEDARSILSENESPDLPFRWSVNPYRGCVHACSYCYARPTHHYLGFGAGTDFDSKLVAKRNAPALLRKALRAATWEGEPLHFSGVTDCYQPLEVTWQLTRRCLEVCVERENPAVVITKSGLVARDIDVLVDLHRVAGAQVFLSIPFANARVARAVEPGAPSPQRRLETVRLLADAGLEVSVLVSPLIPGLSERDLPTILQSAAQHGAQGAHFTPLRLPDPVKALFFERLRQALPGAARGVEGRLRSVRGGALHDGRFGHRFSGTGAYWTTTAQLFAVLAQKFGLRPLPAALPPKPPPPHQPLLFGPG